MKSPSAKMKDLRSDDDEVDNVDDAWVVVSSSPVDPSSRNCVVAMIVVDSAS